MRNAPGEHCGNHSNWSNSKTFTNKTKKNISWGTSLLVAIWLRQAPTYSSRASAGPFDFVLCTVQTLRLFESEANTILFSV